LKKITNNFFINDISDIVNFRWFYSMSVDCFDSSVSHLDEFKNINTRPKIFDFFRLICNPNGTFVNKNIDCNVFCKPECLVFLYENKEKFNLEENKNEILIVAGGDDHLSVHINTLKKLKPYFSKIFYEAKNIKCDWISIIPMGNIYIYMLANGGNRILDYINSQKNKNQLIGHAFGAKWPRLSRKLTDRRSLLKFSKQNSFMKNFFCDPLEYYQKLSEFKFFATPLGTGIQTPKICESIMCETIPVVTDHVSYRELKKYGIPLLIVKKWEHINEKMLLESLNTEFCNINWVNVKSLYKIDGFVKKFLKKEPE